MRADLQEAGLAEIFRTHFGHREHLYGVLLDELADDVEAGGPTAQICRDHLDATRDEAIQLRLLAAIFRIVLRGDAPQLAPFYPCLGGALPPEGAWQTLRPLLVAHTDELSASLDKAPQTNEVGRSACLAIGLFEAVRRHGVGRVRLLEPGASGGLNLNVDHYRVMEPGWSWGEPGQPLVLDTQAAGIRPETVTVVDRRGCDLNPSTRPGPRARGTSPRSCGASTWPGTNVWLRRSTQAEPIRSRWIEPLPRSGCPNSSLSPSVTTC